MRYLSICSGIEAATTAWHPLGWTAVGFAEIDPFPSAVLSHHYPEVPNFGDFTNIKASDVGHIDLLVGGTPCQSFSVAGLRAGLADDRGNLALEFLRLAERTRPRWVVWENVPGVLSSVSHEAPDPTPPPPPLDLGCGGATVDVDEDYEAEESHAFACFLDALSELGYGFAYRVLDAQFCRVDGHARAVPQRRRRVFVVGYLGDWRRAAAVLFEPESLLGNSPPRREPTADAARSSCDCAGSGRGLIAHTLLAKPNASHDPSMETHVPVSVTGSVAHTLRAEGFDASEDGTGRGTPLVAFNARQDPAPGLIAGALDTSSPQAQAVAIADQWAVRRLTPTECERLQGFPDGYTDVPYRNKTTAADGPRYKALGNSMAVNVMRWIGQRIELCNPTRVPETTQSTQRRTRKMKPESMEQFFTAMAQAQASQALASAALAQAFTSMYGSELVEVKPALVAPAAAAKAIEKAAEPKAEPKKPAAKTAAPKAEAKPAEAKAPVTKPATKPAAKPAPAGDDDAKDVTRRTLVDVNRMYDRSVSKAVMDAIGGGAKFDDLDAELYPSIQELAARVLDPTNDDLDGIDEAALATIAAKREQLAGAE